MISFRVPLVLCALIFGQSLASTVQSSTELEGKEIDALIKIVDSLEKLGDLAVEYTIKIVEYLVKNVHNLPKIITNYVSKILTIVKNTADVVLDKVKSYAGKKAGVVIDCAKAAGKTAIVDYSSSVKDASKCVNTEVEKVLVIIPDVVKQLDVILKKVEVITEGLKKCNGGPAKQALCLLAIVKKCQFAAKPLPKIVTDAYHKIKDAVSSLISSNKKCLVGVVEKTRDEALARLNAFGTCVHK
ncbi:unnamed protein product [Acanthoscelides obtectus]|uniref:Uncharacterized protein n=1 Tax=Acanthoscelides obtectus TaxID=200917 RepID=A0A9P0PV25_ACAOB|nr:unnamed protein product [Acanthoscelides obtectus]CAK1630887.1 hypothetical protein AOBTE_LOCUS6616 [Acanthoscelides obtectus]